MTLKSIFLKKKSYLTAIILIFIFSIGTSVFSNIPVRARNTNDYLIAGENSLQHIYYSASSSYTKVYKADKALDDDYKTYWVSKKSNTDHWIQVDFGIKRLLTKIVVVPGKINNSPVVKKFSLQFLHEDKWFDFKTYEVSTSIFNKDDKISINLGGIDASIFRIYIPTEYTTNGQASIAEIECFLGEHKIEFFDRRLKNFAIPIKNGLLPDKASAYPNAPRGYRGGRHAGVDFYHYFDDTTYERIPVTKNTPVIASADGVVVRADWNFKSLSPEKWLKQSKYYQHHPRTFVKNSFGGIQVWIDHGHGLLTAYNHLSQIDPAIQVGVKVKKGQKIGNAGNSGLYGGAVGNNWGIHLHYEIWIDGNYLGFGMEHEVIKKYLRWIFFQLQ